MTDARDGRYAFHLTCPECGQEWDWWTRVRFRQDGCPEGYWRECPRCGSHCYYVIDDSKPEEVTP